jgi:hypothetical protein
MEASSRAVTGGGGPARTSGDDEVMMTARPTTTAAARITNDERVSTVNLRDDAWRTGGGSVGVRFGGRLLAGLAVW